MGEEHILNHENKTISVIGLGRVGLITLFHLAERNPLLHGVDINKDLICKLKKKQIPYLEPGFNSLLKKHHSNIRFSTTFPDTQYNFIAVPTPFNNETQHTDLSHILSVLNHISKSRYNKKYIFIRSTLTPGSCQQLLNQFKNLNPTLSINYFPEFFREGQFVKDYGNAICSMLGSREEEVFQHFTSFQFAKSEWCSPEEAEILKVISNLFHGLKISFANEVGRMAKTFNCSPHRIMQFFLKDTELNISDAYLKPGFSFGGPCLDKDIQALHSVQNRNQGQWILTQCVKKSNEIHTQWAAKQILKLNPNKIGILGCSFTGNQTLDYRGSTVLKLIEILSCHEDICVYGMEEVLKSTSCYIVPEKFPEKLAECDILILGGWTPLIEEHKPLLSDYQGILFDLLVQNAPEYIKNHPNYKSLYSPE